MLIGDLVLYGEELYLFAGIAGDGDYLLEDDDGGLLKVSGPLYLTEGSDG